MGEDRKWRNMSRRERAEVKFCEDFTTAQLEGRTLAEVIEAAENFRESSVRYMLALKKGSEILQHSTYADALGADNRLMRALNHFRSTGHD